MRLILKHVLHETATIATYRLQPAGTFEYLAGQYAELILPHDYPDDRGVKRWFTLSGAPGHKLLSITVKYFGDDNSSTFKKALFRLKPGAELQMSQPMGDFVLPKDIDIPLVFVAGGMGVTPFHSMFEWMAQHKEKRDITFLYSVHSEDDIIFQNTFERAGIHARIFVVNPGRAWGGERGRLSAEQIIALSHPTPNTLIYISGPELMAGCMAQELETNGLSKRQIVTDFFPGYSEI